MATDTEDGEEGDEAEGVADVEGFAHPVGRNSRPSERENTILENQRCFRNCDFMARSPNKLSCSCSHAYYHREVASLVIREMGWPFAYEWNSPLGGQVK